MLRAQNKQWKQKNNYNQDWGAEHDFNCYGVKFEEKDHIKCPVDCTQFLGLKENSEECTTVDAC